MRSLKLPTAPDDYAFMLAEDYASAVQQQHQAMQVCLDMLSRAFGRVCVLLGLSLPALSSWFASCLRQSGAANGNVKQFLVKAYRAALTLLQSRTQQKGS